LEAAEIKKPSAGFGPFGPLIGANWPTKDYKGIGNPCKLAGNLNQDSLETLQVGTVLHTQGD